MTSFGEKLKAIIKSNDINIYKLSQRAGINRTTIHKIVSGNRLPDIDFIQKLLAVLPVSPYEKNDLLSAYKVSKDGEFLYNQRIQVHNLIERAHAIQGYRISDSGSNGGIPALYDNANIRSAIETGVVSGVMSVNNLIDDILTRELLSDNPCVKFVLPHDYTFFYDNLLIKYLKTPSLKAECLFELNKNVNASEPRRNANLDIISSLIPFYIHGSRFDAYYVYSMNPAGSTAALPMPYYLVTSSVAVTLKTDLRTAIVNDHPDIIACYRDTFEEVKAISQPLARQVASMDETAEFYCPENVEKSDGVIGFGSHPCISIYYDRPLLDKHLPPEIPDREQTVDIWCSVCDGMRALNKKCPSFSLFTTDGLDLFVERGVIQTIVEKFFSAYSPEERVETLQRMIDDTSGDAMGYRVIDSSKLKIPKCFYADVFGNSHMNVVMRDIEGNTNTIITHEGSIVEAFYDFLTDITTTDMVFNKDDTIKVLSHALERARELL